MYYMFVFICLFRSFRLRHMVNTNPVLKMHDVQNFMVVTDMQMSVHVSV